MNAFLFGVKSPLHCFSLAYKESPMKYPITSLPKYLYLFALVLVSLVLAVSCSSNEESNSSGGASTKSYTVSGYIQKGPFVQGTEITVRELDKELTPTGDTFTSTIDDNTGSFSTKGDLKSSYVELSANGFYFNEVSGKLSTAALTLQALADLEEQKSVNVNLLTHLERKRVEYLIESGSSFQRSKIQGTTRNSKHFWHHGSWTRQL